MKPCKRYMLNKRSGKLHRVPTREDCNVDQVPRRFRHYLSLDGKALRSYKNRCGRCF